MRFSEFRLDEDDFGNDLGEFCLRRKPIVERDDPAAGSRADTRSELGVRPSRQQHVAVRGVHILGSGSRHEIVFLEGGERLCHRPVRLARQELG